MPGDRPVSVELGTTGGRFLEGTGATRRRTRSSVTDLALAGLAVIVMVAILVTAWSAPPPADPDLAAVVPATAVPEAVPSQASPAILVPEPVSSPVTAPAVRTALVFGPPAMPTDAAGSDPEDLPRFPGAQRTTYV
ncbi:hypothetical protein BH24CHL9_BH24CHL9_11210 [soil metagenome]